MTTIDCVNAKLGGSALFFGAKGVKRSWSLRSERLSPRYTTHWDDLPVAKAE